MTRNNTTLPEHIMLYGYHWLTSSLRPLLGWHLKQRIKKGKEDPMRWREKQGHPSLPRPNGKLIWLHAVGLGETLALRGLIEQLHQTNGKLNFLITSSTRQSAKAILSQLPPNTQHQYLPLDTPKYVNAFLDYWNPNFIIFSEQDIWPGFVLTASKRNIPQVWVNARMDKTAFESRKRFHSLLKPVYSKFSFISAQDPQTAEHIKNLLNQDRKHIYVDGSLKPAAPPLTGNQVQIETARKLIGSRSLFLVSPSHKADEEIAIAAINSMPLKKRPLLGFIPRFPERSVQIISNLEHAGLNAQIYKGQTQGDDMDAIVIDEIGAPSTWLPLAKATLVGGTFCEIKGHSPWEAISLEIPVFHGPKFSNFKTDYDQLLEANATKMVKNAHELATALSTIDLNILSKNANGVSHNRTQNIKVLAQRILGIIAQ